jgi:hypothetical protein
LYKREGGKELMVERKFCTDTEEAGVTRRDFAGELADILYAYQKKAFVGERPTLA